jgi:hypothetical protein
MQFTVILTQNSNLPISWKQQEKTGAAAPSRFCQALHSHKQLSRSTSN